MEKNKHWKRYNRRDDARLFSGRGGGALKDGMLVQY